MRFKKQIKKYYQSRIEAQKIPELDKVLQKKINMGRVPKNRKDLVLNFIFHAGIIICFVFILIVNSNSVQSLQKLDPDNQKSYYVQQKFKQGIEKIKNYFRPNPVPDKKEG